MQPPPAGRVGVRHFPAQAPSVRDARRYAADLASSWDLGDVVKETAELLVSELAANAVAASRDDTGGQAAPGPGARRRIALRLTCTDTAMVVEVWDAAAAMPVRRAQVADAESGRGLVIVEALSKELGYYAPAGGGKVVWCSIALSRTLFSSAGGQAGPPCPLPRREAGAAASPAAEPGHPVEMENDVPLLRRALDGLRGLDSWHLPPGGADGAEDPLAGAAQPGTGP